jgi:ribonuclease HI
MTQRTDLPQVTIYTDGACAPNPGPGGWAAILRFESKKNGVVEKELKGSDPSTTSIRMELQAAIEALRALKVKPCRVNFYTDSQYLYRGATEWLSRWEENKWHLRDGRKVKNVDLWQALNELLETHEVSWYWVKGHADDPLNKRVDEMARSQIPRPKLPEDDAEAYHLYIRTASVRGWGGWGVIIRLGEETQESSGNEANATGNRMELRAAIEGLRAANEGSRVHVYTTSDYLYSGIVNDIAKWQQNGWLTTTSKPVRYRRLWEELLELQTFRQVNWHWLKTRPLPDESQRARQLALARIHDQID